MTTLDQRPNTALIVIDVQNGVMKSAYDRDAVVANLATLVEKARGADVPVVWVQHDSEELPKGTETWEIVPELDHRANEPHIEKQYGDSFEATNLEEVLAGLGVGKLIVSGAQTDACVRSTLHGAFTRGYDTVLVGDAHSTEDLSEWGAPSPDKVISHTNLYWSFQDGPGREAGVVTTEEVDFGAAANGN